MLSGGGLTNTAVVVSQGSHTITAPITFDSMENDIAIHNAASLNLSGVVSIGSSSTLRKVGLGTALASGPLNFNGGIDYRSGANVVHENGIINFNLTSDATGPGVPNFAIAGGATLNASGIGDPFTNGALAHATITNDGVFNVLANTKHVASISGNGTTGVSPFATLEVGSGGPVTQSNFTVNGVANVGSLSVANFVTVGNGTMAASLSAKHIRAGSLQIQSLGLASIKPDGTTDATSKVGTFLIAGATDAWTGKLDLDDNDLIIDYAIGASPLETLKNQIKSSYNGGSWNGNGVSTSLGDASTHALAYADNAVFGVATFSGQAVDATSLLVKYSFYGDSDLDGDVDVADLGNLASNWQSSAYWTGGDFDYNGSVNVNDLGLLASNWQAGVGSPLAPSFASALASVGLGSTSVPEPKCLALLLGLACLGLRRQNASLIPARVGRRENS
jgi:hypothetical protein